jgi:hypothetical protein
MYRGWFTGTVTHLLYLGERTEFVALHRKDARGLQKVGLLSVSSLNTLWKIGITENGKEALNSRNSEQVCRLYSSGLQHGPVETSCENINPLAWSEEVRSILACYYDN